MKQSAQGAHGHGNNSLSAALASAVSGAMHGSEHDHAIVIITGITEKDGEYDVSVIVIFLDEEASLHPLDHSQKEEEEEERERIVKEETMEDFYAAEHHMVPLEKEKQFEILKENTMEVLEDLLDNLEIAFYLSEDASVSEELEGAPTIDLQTISDLKATHHHIIA